MTLIPITQESKNVWNWYIESLTFKIDSLSWAFNMTGRDENGYTFD